MSNPNIPKDSSTDSLDLGMSPLKSTNLTSRFTPSSMRLRDHLKEAPIESIQFEVRVPEVDNNIQTEQDTILNPDGTIDFNKFTNSMFQSNLTMKHAMGDRNQKSTSLTKLKEKRLTENPPLLMPTATYLDYMTWMDLILGHLKRHPDFIYQFLTSPPVTATDERN